MAEEYSPTETWTVWSDAAEPIARHIPREQAWAMVDEALTKNADTDIYACGDETGTDYEGE